jgi:hypothetical protein
MSLSLAPIILLASVEGLSYHITIDGPDGVLDDRCQDPCRIEQLQVVGTTTGGTTTTTSDLGEDDTDVTEGAECWGACGSRSTEVRITIRPSRSLREGIEVRIDDGRAHFLFYDVVEADGGRSTRRRHSEFVIDRSPIVLELHGNQVRVETTGLGDGG